MKLLHYTTTDGNLSGEYVILLEDDDCTESYKETACEPGYSLSSESTILPGRMACLPTEMRLVVNGAHLP